MRVASQPRHHREWIQLSESRRSPMSEKPNVVLVHGAWADGSSWSAVIEKLQANGFTVTAPQFPETSLAADVARLRQVLRRQDGPTVVAGHSYCGPSLTAPRTHSPKGGSPRDLAPLWPA